MADTFACDNCGNEFPRRQMKEAFKEEGHQRVKEELCANCLDERMNGAAEVRGVAGDEKKVAVHINEEPQGTGDNIDLSEQRESFGVRET